MCHQDEPTALTPELLAQRYSLLCRACDAEVSPNRNLDIALTQLEKIIREDLPELARQGSPANVADILRAFEAELARFRDFCEFPLLASKSVVAVGGAFSAGKSSFINRLIKTKCLATEVDPTTSLPTYVLRGKPGIMALNTYNRAVSITPEEFATLTHDEKQLYGSQVSRLLQSAFVTLPEFSWQNLTLLDTPGYTKSEDEGRGTRTDANLAKAQLNSANYIIWAMSAESGTISEEDLIFLASLKRDIPKLVVVTRADKRDQEDIDNVVALVCHTLANRGIEVLDVVPYSNRKKRLYPIESVTDYMDRWNLSQHPLQFAQEFKRQFLHYQRYIDEQNRIANLRLHRLNRILALSEDSDLTNEADALRNLAQKELHQLERLGEKLTSNSVQFFSQLKYIGDMAGVALPEPSAVELMDFEESNLLDMLRSLREQLELDEPAEPQLDTLLSDPIPESALAKILRRDFQTVPILEALLDEPCLDNLPAMLREKRPVQDVLDLLALGNPTNVDVDEIEGVRL